MESAASSVGPGAARLRGHDPGSRQDGQQCVRLQHAERPGIHCKRRSLPAPAVNPSRPEFLDAAWLPTFPANFWPFPREQAEPKPLESYATERPPINGRTVARPDQSIAEFRPNFEAFGLADYVKTRAARERSGRPPVAAGQNRAFVRSSDRCSTTT